MTHKRNNTTKTLSTSAAITGIEYDIWIDQALQSSCIFSQPYGCACVLIKKTLIFAYVASGQILPIVDRVNIILNKHNIFHNLKNRYMTGVMLTHADVYSALSLKYSLLGSFVPILNWLVIPISEVNTTRILYNLPASLVSYWIHLLVELYGAIFIADNQIDAEEYIRNNRYL